MNKLSIKEIQPSRGPRAVKPADRIYARIIRHDPKCGKCEQTQIERKHQHWHQLSVCLERAATAVFLHLHNELFQSGGKFQWYKVWVMLVITNSDI